ncbi:MAG: S41 family peptidase, partial [Polaribacter sp.]
IADPENSANVIGYVTHILSNSDATTKNIARGDFFNAVNNTPLTKTNFENLLVSGADTFTLNMVNFSGTTATSNGKMVSLTKQNYNYPATFLEKTITIGADKIGYLMYNNPFSDTYIDGLNNDFLKLKNQNVRKLILDLRYAIGSTHSVKNIANVATMITGQFANQILLKKQWNTKAQAWFQQNQPNKVRTKFPTKLNETTDINSLNVTDVYIILDGKNFSGSSAIELLINSLKPYINVHVIGTKTAGKNKGLLTLYDSEDYNFALRNESHTVAIQPVVLSFYNKNDKTYEKGFVPDVTLCPNEDTLNLGVLGERSDPILDRVLKYITSGNVGVNPACNTTNFEFIYNTTDVQTPLEKGFLINQNLPNTNL